MKNCPVCKATNIPDAAKFCPVCGSELKEKSNSQAVDAELTATNLTIRKYRATTISWSAKGVKKVKFDGEILPCPGVKHESPRGAKKYVVEYLNAEGETICSKSITIEVTPNWYILFVFIASLILIGIIAASNS